MIKKILSLLLFLPILSFAQQNTLPGGATSIPSPTWYKYGTGATSRLFSYSNGEYYPHLTFQDTTSLLQTITNFFPKGDTRYSKLVNSYNYSTNLSFSTISSSITNLGESNLLMLNSTTCANWYRLVGGTSILYTTANNALLNNWAAPTTCTGLPSGYLFPTVFTVPSYSALYYMFLTNTTETSIYLYSSADGIAWSVMNSGNPVITSSATNTDWDYHIYNVGVTVVGTKLHLLVEGGGATSGTYSTKSALGYATADISAPIFTLGATPVINTLSNYAPALMYIPERNSILAFYANSTSYSTLGADLQILTATASLSNDLTLASSWVTSGALFTSLGLGSDPSFVFTPGKTHPFMMMYNINQSTGEVAYSDVANNTLQLYNSINGYATATDLSKETLATVTGRGGSTLTTAAFGGSVNTYDASYNLQVGTETGTHGLIIRSGTTGVGKVSFDAGINGNGTGRIWYDHSAKTMSFYTSSTGSNSVLALKLDSSQNVNIPVLTASKVVFTDASKNLTSIGIGPSTSFIMGDGSLNSNTYLTASTGVSNITGTPNQVIASASTGAITLSLPQSIATTSSPTFAAATVTGIISANNFISGWTSAATGSSYTLTATSTDRWYFTGGSNSTVTLPNTSTLTVGRKFSIVRDGSSSGTITVNASDGSLVQAILPSSGASFTAITTGVTSNAAWLVEAINKPSSLIFQDATTPSLVWQWYSTGNIARLNNSTSGDVVTIATNGNTTAPAFIVSGAGSYLGFQNRANSGQLWQIFADGNGANFYFSGNKGVISPAGNWLFGSSTTDNGVDRVQVGGSLNTTGKISIGNTSSTSTATPLTLDLGGTYSNTAGANPKILLYNSGTNPYGIGASANQIDYIIPAGGSHAFWAGATKRFSIDGSGNLNATGNLTLGAFGTGVAGTDAIVTKSAAGLIGSIPANSYAIKADTVDAVSQTGTYSRISPAMKAGVYEINSVLDINSITTDVLKVTISWTDHAGNSRSADLFNQGATSANMSTADSSHYPPLSIYCQQGSTITYSVVSVSGGGSHNFNFYARAVHL